MEEKISIRRARTAIPGLLDLIEYVNTRSKKKFEEFEMVEVGSFVGDSAGVFAPRCKLLHCVDPWENGYDEKDPSSFTWDMEVIEKQFDEFCDKHDNIIKHKMTSVKGAELFDDESLDFIYIDGNHLYEAVKEDIKAWLPKLKKPGFIAGHDYQHKLAPGVKPAVIETIGQIDQHFQDTSWVKYIG